VITGTLTTVVTAKTIKPNAIVTLTQVVKVAVPTSVTVQSITVNGIATQVQSSTPAPTPSKRPSAGSTPAPSTTPAPTTSQVVSATTTTVVGPDDKVKVNATTDSGQKIQGVVEIEKVDPFTLANVNFDFASAKLTPAAKKILDQVAAVVIDHGFNVIQLTGHTDVLASPGYSNQVLSDQRAAAVRAYLAKKLAGEGVVVQSLGLAAKEPVIAKTDEASRALNRRVEILVATK
jgi:outer membrane protein OmpA-like peptidoglycan-associated protein